MTIEYIVYLKLKTKRFELYELDLLSFFLLILRDIIMRTSYMLKHYIPPER